MLRWRMLTSIRSCSPEVARAPFTRHARSDRHEVPLRSLAGCQLLGRTYGRPEVFFWPPANTARSVCGQSRGCTLTRAVCRMDRAAVGWLRNAVGTTTRCQRPSWRATVPSSPRKSIHFHGRGRPVGRPPGDEAGNIRFRFATAASRLPRYLVTRKTVVRNDGRAGDDFHSG
jgi:hypothetical protein